MLLEQADDRERRPGRDEGLPLLPDVAAILHRLDDRCPRRRPTDAELLEALHQAGLGEPRRGRGAVPLGGEVGDRHPIADGELREEHVVAGLALVVAVGRGAVEHRSVTGERDRGSARGEQAVGRVIGGRPTDPHADGDTAGVSHLRSEGPLPDERVEGELLAIADLSRHRLRRAEGGGRPDRLVGLLSVLRLRGVLLWSVGEIARPVLGFDRGACRRERLVGEDDVVGPHIGDEALLVEALGQPHHLRGGEPQSTSGLLLERRGHERSLRRRPIRLLLDRANRDVCRREPQRQASRLRLVEHPHALVGPSRRVEVAAGRHPDAVDLEKAGGEGWGGGGEQLEIPVAGGDESDPLSLALDDEPDRRALNAPGGQTPVHLSPEDR